MIIIPGQLISLLTFPGVVMHEIAHRFMCDILKVPVYEVRYFNIGATRAGHVIHHKTNNTAHTILISFAPLLFNSILCMIFTFPFMAANRIISFEIANPLSIILWWIGISIGANAFPSNQDTAAMFATESKGVTYGAIYIAHYIMRFLNFLSIAWIDFAYAFLLSLTLPYLIFR